MQSIRKNSPALIALLILTLGAGAVLRSSAQNAPWSPTDEPSTGMMAATPQVSFSGDLQVGGHIATDQGIVFPDGTVQTTAAGTTGHDGSGVTANVGLYDNRIAQFVPTMPYVEICFKNRATHYDVHTIGGESTDGGNCLPGDRGWIMEREERAALAWESARVTCLLEEMRLPEPFEYMFGCVREQTIGLVDMTGNDEWVSNAAVPVNGDTYLGLAASAMGSAACSYGTWGWVARDAGGSDSLAYRCVL